QASMSAMNCSAPNAQKAMSKLAAPYGSAAAVPRTARSGSGERLSDRARVCRRDRDARLRVDPARVVELPGRQVEAEGAATADPPPPRALAGAGPQLEHGPH